MSKTLTMSFLNEEGRKATVRLNTVKEDVTELEVQSAMDLILAKNIFSSKGGDLKLKDSAVIVNRENTELSVR
ncbi:MAG TPA: DUF2922 domain-containing protein [Clostridiaceae bacterium]|nr:DUF2922 domain-containing protein [Clostridiaceae bacterium]